MSEITIQPDQSDEDVINANENAFAHSYMLGGNWRAPGAGLKPWRDA
jgi:hypothetical protein